MINDDQPQEEKKENKQPLENQFLTVVNIKNQPLEEEKNENQPVIKQNNTTVWYNPVQAVAKMTVDVVGEMNARMAVGAASGSVTGAYVGSIGVGLTFAAIGLSPLGPVAGGLFALNMGAGLTAGSFMALAQSAAMTGAGCVYGGYAGGAIGGIAGAVAGAFSAPAATVEKKQF